MTLRRAAGALFLSSTLTLCPAAAPFLALAAQAQASESCCPSERPSSGCDSCPTPRNPKSNPDPCPSCAFTLEELETSSAFPSGLLTIEPARETIAPDATRLRLSTLATRHAVFGASPPLHLLVESFRN